MSIRFTCTQCNKRFSLKDSLAGKKGKCSCGAVIRVPLKSDSVSGKVTAQKQAAQKNQTNVKSPPSPKQVAVPENTRSTAARAYCFKCDMQSTPGSNFCQWCGVPLSNQTV